MARQNFQDELSDLRIDVLRMGESVRGQLADGLHALHTDDRALAKRVVERDKAINETYLEIEQFCIDLIALQQPVASDLRFISASFKIITDLERIGDLATNLAQYSLAADRKRVVDVDVEQIGDDAASMVRDALAAYAARDLDACYEIEARDDDLDVLCQTASQQAVRDLLETERTGAEGWQVEQVLDGISRLLLTIRDLERVGDHAVNIAARTLYMIDNDPELLY